MQHNCVHLLTGSEVDLDPITSFTLSTWYSIVKQLKVGKELALLRWVAYDGTFKAGGLDLRFKQWECNSHVPID